MKRLVLLTLLAAAPLLVALPAQAAYKSPVVVELFTSQGCSSCPPANANLIKLSDRTDVLALSFAVTYWDYLGWKDVFGRPEYTDRQVAYEKALGQRGAFTPQMVINGASTVVGNNFGDIEQAIGTARPLAGPEVSLQQGVVRIGTGDAPASGADVWLVSYDPRVIEVPVGRGENSGRTLPHTDVVHSLRRLGPWTGAAVTFDLPTMQNRLRTAVLVQQTHGGAILAAVSGL